MDEVLPAAGAEVVAPAPNPNGDDEPPPSVEVVPNENAGLGCAVPELAVVFEAAVLPPPRKENLGVDSPGPTEDENALENADLGVARGVAGDIDDNGGETFFSDGSAGMLLLSGGCNVEAGAIASFAQLTEHKEGKSDEADSTAAVACERRV